MAAKPGSTPRWANVGGAIVTPGAGKLDVGHVTAERPPAQYENWFKNLAWQWFEYLKDGAMSGAFTFDSTVAVAGLITATAGLTCAANQHVTVSGTGKYKRGTRVRAIHAAAAQRSGGGASGNLQDAGWQYGSAGEILRFALPLEEGERLTTISAIMTDNGTDTLRMLCYKNTVTIGGGSAATQLGTQQNTAGSTGVAEALTVSGLTETIGSGLVFYYVDLECLTISSGLMCHGIVITTDIV